MTPGWKSIISIKLREFILQDLQGEDTSYDIKNRIFLDRLEGVPDEERTARFVCAVAAVFPDGTA